MLHSPDEVFRASEADRQKPRSEMKCWRLESERAKLFVPEISGKALQIKNVVELSFLRPSAVPEVLKNMNERTMLRSNEESETEPWRLLWYSGRGLIFRIATAKGAPLMRSPVQRRGRRLAELLRSAPAIQLTCVKPRSKISMMRASAPAYKRWLDRPARILGPPGLMFTQPFALYDRTS